MTIIAKLGALATLGLIISFILLSVSYAANAATVQYQLFFDGDGDGWGDKSMGIVSEVSSLTDFVSNPLDPHDANSFDRPELVGDGLDNDLDGQIDELDG